jgi:hypothetical protein
MLYHLLPDAPQSTYDPRKKLGPQADGIVGSANVKSTDLVTNQLKELSLSQSAGGLASSMSSNPTQSVDVHSMQSLTNPNGSQQPGGNKKKGRNNRKGGKNVIKLWTIMRRWVVMLKREKEKNVRWISL